MWLMNCLAAEQRHDLRAARDRLRTRERNRRRYRRIAADPKALARRRRTNAMMMRRYRADLDKRVLCPGVDLPGEGSTCGKMIDATSNRCIACHNRRQWLVQQYNLGDLRVLASTAPAHGHDPVHSSFSENGSPPMEHKFAKPPGAAAICERESTRRAKRPDSRSASCANGWRSSKDSSKACARRSPESRRRRPSHAGTPHQRKQDLHRSPRPIRLRRLSETAIDPTGKGRDDRKSR